MNEVVEAARGRAEMPDRIEALNYVRTTVRSSVRPLLPEPAVRGQRTQIQKQILFEVQDRILGEPPRESSPQPPADPQGVAFEEFAKVFRDKEAVLSDKPAIRRYEE